MSSTRVQLLQKGVCKRKLENIDATTVSTTIPKRQRSLESGGQTPDGVLALMNSPAGDTSPLRGRSPPASPHETRRRVGKTVSGKGISANRTLEGRRIQKGFLEKYTSMLSDGLTDIVSPTQSSGHKAKSPAPTGGVDLEIKSKLVNHLKKLNS